MQESKIPYYFKFNLALIMIFGLILKMQTG